MPGTVPLRKAEAADRVRKRFRQFDDGRRQRGADPGAMLPENLYLFDLIGDPKGIRTPVTAVKGQCPGPLDDGVVKAGIDLAMWLQEINYRARQDAAPYREMKLNRF